MQRAVHYLTGMPAIWASQHPAECSRFLLYEDDLDGQGMGYSMEFHLAVLMLAMYERRVLLEVPVDPAWAPLGGGNISRVAWNTSHRYAHSSSHRPARRPRWCSEGPRTWNCFYKPLRCACCPRTRCPHHPHSLGLGRTDESSLSSAAIAACRTKVTRLRCCTRDGRT